MGAPVLRPAPETVIDGFRLKEQLHVSATATLWRVVRELSNSPLLMKIPALRGGANPINIVGFEVEQMILPRLVGPHVPRFVASGGVDNPYLVMELIAGESLKSCLRRLPLPYEEVAELGAKVAFALHEVHRQHVLHLDLKPSNVMLRTDGNAVLIDFGFSRHERLPDLLAEEFPGPIGTGPYISPEQLAGIRSDLRSDIFALGVMLYFFTTGERPFGDPQTVGGWRQRLFREPVPPRARRPDCPPWLQEVILRCLEVDPDRRHATAAQLVFDLQHPEQIPLTERAAKVQRSGDLRTMLKRWAFARRPRTMARQVQSGSTRSPIIVAALDLAPGMEPLGDAIRLTVDRILRTETDARLACVSVMKLSRVALDPAEDEEGRNLHLRRLAELQHWAGALPSPAHGITFHVFEAVDPAAALIDYARNNHVDHIVMGARANSAIRRYLGSVSSRVVAEAPCTVTVVRTVQESGRFGDGA